MLYSQITTLLFLMEMLYFLLICMCNARACISSAIHHLGAFVLVISVGQALASIDHGALNKLGLASFCLHLSSKIKIILSSLHLLLPFLCCPYVGKECLI